MKSATGIVIATTALMALMAYQPAYAKSCGLKFVRAGKERTGPGPEQSLRAGTQMLMIARWQQKVARDLGPNYASWARADKRKTHCEVTNIGKNFHISCVATGIPCRP